MENKIKKYTVKELIAILKTMPRDALVFSSNDEEGNEISPFGSIGRGKIGKKIEYAPGKYFIEGDDYHGIDMLEDDGKDYIILYPVL